MKKSLHRTVGPGFLALVGLAAGLWLGSCYNPSIVPGGLHCSEGGMCPDGFVCHPTGRCYKPDSGPTDCGSISLCNDPAPAGQACNVVCQNGCGCGQRCNVAGSMGQKHWYRLAANLPGSTVNFVQLELWDNLGAFTGTTVATGTYTITGADASFNTCGVCVRGLGDKGLATQKEYFATSGTVNVTALGPSGQPVSATLTNIQLGEVDAGHNPVTGGCAANVAASQVSGTEMDVTMGQCPSTVGD